MKRLIIAALFILIPAVGVPATFTSVQSGNWNDNNTWGTAGTTKGTDWPGLAGDVVNIGTTANQSHVVVYNVSETNQMGAITIGAATGTGTPVLSFSPTDNTKLTIGAANLTVAATGELKIGTTTDNAIIPNGITAELIWVTTGDDTNGLIVNADGKVTIAGDPAHYGSSFRTTLATQASFPAATNAYTITVSGNYAGKWQVGQELIVHSGTTYVSTTQDYVRLEITSVTDNGANTDIATTVTERPKSFALTSLVGADVYNMNRNVKSYKLSYVASLGTQGTNRIKFTNSNAIAAYGTYRINIRDAEFACWSKPVTGNNVYFDGVIRNGNYGMQLAVNSYLGGIVMGGYRQVTASHHCTVSAHLISGLSGERAMSYNEDLTFTGISHGCTHGSYNNYYSNIGGYIYSVGGGGAVVGGKENTITASVGYNPEGLAVANGADFSLQIQDTVGGSTRSYLKNVKVQATPSWNATYLNNPIHRGRYLFEDYKQVAGAHFIQDTYGTINKVSADNTSSRPSQRSGGSNNVLEALPTSQCAINAPLELLNSHKTRIYSSANVSKTYRLYVQSTFTSLPTANFKLYAEYLDQATGGRTATVSSTQNITTRSNADDWSQYVEVTVNPAQDGYVSLYLSLMSYQDASTKVWVDPSLTGYSFGFSYGEIEYYPAALTVSGLDEYNYRVVDCNNMPLQKGVHVVGNKILNNFTVANCPGGAFSIASNSSINNSIGYTSGDDVYIDSGYTVTARNNLLGDSAKSGAGTYTDTGSATQWSTNPLFTSSSNFALLSSSPAINAGVDVGLTTDYRGMAVPQGSAPDIGAYEFGPGDSGYGGAYRGGMGIHWMW